ncbi:alpha/beta hydrolase-fold protein [Gordonia sp. NPDC003376]
MAKLACRPPRPNSGRASRRLTLATAAIATAIGLASGISPAFAVDPTIARTSAGCSFASTSDRTNDVQTCKVWSESMQTYVTVKVRPSDQLAGEQEQAVYFLGGINDPSGSAGSSLYSTQYNLVMINGSTSTWSSNWQSPPLDSDGNPLTTSSGDTYDPQWETFIGEELPAYLNENFAIDQTGNAIVGLSISGGQAVNLALKYPDIFKVALSTSGYYQTDNPIGWILIPFILSSRQGISNGLDGMWGNPFSAGNSWAANDVFGRIWQTKPNGQTIIVSTGNGLIASQAEWDELMALGGIGEAVMGSVLEFVSFVSAVILNAQAAILGLPVDFIYTNGAHTWQRWGRTDEEEAQKVQDALKKYQVPTTTTTSADSASAASLVANDLTVLRSLTEVPTADDTTAPDEPDTIAATADSPTSDEALAPEPDALPESGTAGGTSEVPASATSEVDASVTSDSPVTPDVPATQDAPEPSAGSLAPVVGPDANPAPPEPVDEAASDSDAP